MSKTRKKSPSRKASETTTSAGRGGTTADTKRSTTKGHATRETIESIVVAIILAFLFRGFLMEAFVIPTGSMAPTLQGRHKDVECPQCHYWYRVGASSENGLNGARTVDIVSTTCPICRYTLDLNFRSPDHWSFSGDRILVNKFCYDLSDPQRWDVIVFKYPGNAVQNYIKRLVGLPNETLRIFRGDIYTAPWGTDPSSEFSAFQIQRKPDHKLWAMLQLVDDTYYIAPKLEQVGWQRWQPWSLDGNATSKWQNNEEGWGWQCEGEAGQDLLLRYHHLVPSVEHLSPTIEVSDWKRLEDNRPLEPPLAERRGQLISDFYAYNTGRKRDDSSPIPLGVHWVGDLALEGQVEVLGSQGELILDLVEAGARFQCRIDVATGTATLNVSEANYSFDSAAGSSTAGPPRGATPIRRPGKYTVRFSNVDDEVRLWVDGRRIPFDRPTTYSPPHDLRPQWRPSDPGDLAPAGIGSQGLALRVDRLKLFRDIYYIATMSGGDFASDYRREVDLREIQHLFRTPEQWANSPWFDSLGSVDFQLREDQFFPMGDNSPQSSDARVWDGRLAHAEDPGLDHYVHRDLLIGKAVVIYWPHHWYKPIPFWPNFRRMGFIR